MHAKIIILFATVAVAMCAPAENDERRFNEKNEESNFENREFRFRSFNDDAKLNRRLENRDFDSYRDALNVEARNNFGTAATDARRFEDEFNSNRNAGFRVLNEQQARTNAADSSRALANDNFENWSRNAEAIRNSWAPLSLNNAFNADNENRAAASNNVRAA